MANYVGVELLKITCKGFEKCIDDPLQKYSANYLANYRYNFVRKLSVPIFLLQFLLDMRRALDSNSNESIVDVWTDFFKVFDRAPYKEFLRKVTSSESVASCLTFCSTSWKDLSNLLGWKTSAQKSFQCRVVYPKVHCWGHFSSVFFLTTYPPSWKSVNLFCRQFETLLLG